MTNTRHNLENVSSRMCYCDVCCAVREYSTAETVLETEIKKTLISYTAIECRCKECGTLCYPVDVVERNTDTLRERYRLAAGLASKETISAIPEKYAITVRPLSLVLGWGEQTYTRYMNGEIPSRSYSDTLERVYNDEKYYRYLLCKNSSLIPLSVVQKSLQTTNRLIGDISEDMILRSVAAYICSKKEEISSLALEKLVYFSHGFYLGYYDDNCFSPSSKCEAWAAGPVYPTVYYLRKEGTLFIPKGSEYTLSNELRKIVDCVIKYFGRYDGETLAEFTHLTGPWKDFYSDSAVTEIPITGIRDHFYMVIADRPGTPESCIKKYAEELINKLFNMDDNTISYE